MNTTEFKTSGKTVKIFKCEKADKPVIYLNDNADIGADIYGALGKTDFTLAVISDLDWNKDMSPWEIPPISRNDTPCTGGADEYLNILVRKIVCETEKSIEGKPLWRGIAGYSLAGLFAVYSMYKTNMFSRLASISGSLWFPNFKEYVFSREPVTKPDCIYFSLGDKEDRTKNKVLKPVRENTEEIVQFYGGKKIPSTFVLNEGNHFNNAAERTAAGIEWILNF